MNSTVETGKQWISTADLICSPELLNSRIEISVRAETALGMLSQRERRLLVSLASRPIGRDQLIVDAGTFLGSSTVSLAEGFRSNAQNMNSLALRQHRPIVGFDAGYLPAPKGAAGPITREIGGYAYTWGQSFEPVLRHNIAGLDHLVELRIGDFLNQSWNQEDKIAICFIDLAKSHALNFHCFREFFPAFIPANTILIQQDFFFDRLPWIKVLMGYLSEHFRWLGQVGPSSVYLITSAIPAEKFRFDPYVDVPPDQRIVFHKACEDPRLPVRRSFALAISLAYLLNDAFGPEAAIEEIDRVAAKFDEYMTGALNARMRLERARTQFSKRLRS